MARFGDGGAGGGGGGASAFTFDQNTPLAHWDIVHNLGFFPNVTVVDSADHVMVGDVTYLDANHLTVDFAAQFAGQAFLS